ncbi:dnaJ homolog subfamily C member 17-like [Procambarus clarkii]|uniref:dnaJ homolog subfamily C member 17-like n=1 Tax=Procambarus clarkii TaxID=6728 RepID=UPI0037441C36
MSQEHNTKLSKLDFYQILGITIDAEEKDIKKSYRQRALKCHPDKNPDNPFATDEFDKLEKILEILLDPGTRKAYDKTLKSRKAAAARAREHVTRSQKLRSDLEERERRVQRSREQQDMSEEQFRRELKRLDKEGEQLILEELDRVNREVGAELFRSSSKVSKSSEPPAMDTRGHKVKVKWMSTDDWPGYSQQEINQLFYKWGDINALVMVQKNRKGTALIEYKTKNAADMAVQFERGQTGKPVKVTHMSCGNNLTGQKFNGQKIDILGQDNFDISVLGRLLDYKQHYSRVSDNWIQHLNYADYFDTICRL